MVSVEAGLVVANKNLPPQSFMELACVAYGQRLVSRQILTRTSGPEKLTLKICFRFPT